MPPDRQPRTLRIGVDVGGTFTDLVAYDGNTLRVLKLPSTPPDFHRAVIDAVAAAAAGHVGPVEVVHGSTVATNALLERRGEPVAFVTTEGFRDLLLIGRQNRPDLYALRVARPPPMTLEANWFTVLERVAADGTVVTPLDPAEADALADAIVARGLRHVAICLIFGYANSAHERLLADRCRAAGLTVSLSSDVLPEFREYERASTTVINAALRPRVADYLSALGRGMAQGKSEVGSLKSEKEEGRESSTASLSDFRLHTSDFPLSIMHSAGGTLSVAEASASAARLVLSGPAGGVIGAALVAAAAGVADAVTYDMGGTSTDVATIVGGQPQWSTEGVIDGLPIKLPALDIHTVGAGGGSVAYLDAGGALRVGPRSAGAVPGPACYGRGGTEPTVTDANVVLGRIRPVAFAGGRVRLDADLARRAIAPLAEAMGKSVEVAAAGMVRVAEEAMSRAARTVTSRRGLDPRRFALLSFGGAGGLHACAVAASLDVGTVLVPPYCGVLSALGMVAAPPVADASKTVLHLGEQLDDHRLYAEFGHLNMLASERLPQEQLAAVEAHADLRFVGQSHELTVRAHGADRERLEAVFRAAYADRYGAVPEGRAIEIVTLRLRRVGRVAPVELPTVEPDPTPIADGTCRRPQLLAAGPTPGPLLVEDDEATTYVPPGWTAACDPRGIVTLIRSPAPADEADPPRRHGDTESNSAPAANSVPPCLRGGPASPVDPVELEIARNLFEAAAEEMGITLARAAFSANIKERRDFSCALFDPAGELLAQAAHIPVHLGAMPASVAAVRARLGDLAEGDVAIVNDPFAGGSHLPDVTVVSPVFAGGQRVGSAANRAHHADVGGASPGSMTLSTHIDEEGLRIEPALLYRGGVRDEALVGQILSAVRTPAERLGDIDAQLAANAVGARALQRMVAGRGRDAVRAYGRALQDYSAAFMSRAIAAIPDGVYRFADALDGDGTAGGGPVRIAVELTIAGDRATANFTGSPSFPGSADQVPGCVNCPEAVTRSAVYYCFACLLDPAAPLNGGAFRNVDVRTRPGSVLHARYPAAVVAGNTETSQRVVDVVFGALAQALPGVVPAASCGTMSSIALGGIRPADGPGGAGGSAWTYYETVGGGSGAAPGTDGASAVQCHMTNTLNTPAEAIELQYPLRVRRFESAVGTGGACQYQGGDGIVREIEALAPCEGTLLAD
ncbi:MAG: methylhydantoinase, partial [Phycisphaerales bacterium]|nr:methylhydantoinase [Phycisphaerales bacterium]